MTTWKKHKLSSVAKVIDCPHSTPKWINEGIFVVRNFNLSNGKIVRDKSSYTDLETFEKRTLRATPRFGDCILSREAPIGSIGYISTNEKVCLGQRVVLIRPTNIDPAFLKFKLLSDEVQNQFRQSDNSGSTVSNLRIPSIENTQLTLPDEDIQIQISSVISAYDDLIDNNEKRIKILEEMAQRLYTEWFVKFKFPGYEKVKLVDSGTDFGVIPEGWIITTFGKIMELKYGKALKSENRKMGKYPVFGSSGIVGFNNVYLVKGPGIVIGRKGNAGSVHWVKSNFFPIDTTYYIASDIDLIYCYYLLKNFDFITGDVAIPGLNRTQTNLSEVLFPSDALRTRFIDMVRPLRLYIAALESKNSVLSESRDLLISQLVTGKRQVKN